MVVVALSTTMSQHGIFDQHIEPERYEFEDSGSESDSEPEPEPQPLGECMFNYLII